MFPGPLERDCPALLWKVNEQKYHCSLAAHYPEVADYVEIGLGCLAPTDWREDLRIHTKVDVKSAIRYHQPSEALLGLLRRIGTI